MQTTEMPTTGRMILAMGELGKHVYGGTVPPHVIAKRRARNKAARKSRRINRGH